MTQQKKTCEIHVSSNKNNDKKRDGMLWLSKRIYEDTDKHTHSHIGLTSRAITAVGTA
jgi:hypothetical protein